MSRYIDADEFMTALNNAQIEFSDTYEGLGRAKFLLSLQPTADVVEVRHGHWIERIEKPSWLEDDVEVYYDCSECGTSHWSIMPPYCPECGAKMDGERREE